jgi:hypothetical protein
MRRNEKEKFQFIDFFFVEFHMLKQSNSRYWWRVKIEHHPRPLIVTKKTKKSNHLRPSAT